ncbi:MAG: excinuclease ABC subunit UvrC [Spirochaetales bacterium]|nr:excinuclease ABC subunit UvrC [Spirochaetales bacterium]
MYEAVKTTVGDFPHSPGVYLMKNVKGTIIYIGKAKDLKKRVSSYFTGTPTVKTRVLVSKIDSIEYIVTGNEYEALLLENNLIKENSPRYNINLKDGKSYPAIRITNEEFPRIFRTRRIVQDGSRYFGPYTDVGNIDIYLELIEKLFPLRKCRGPLKKREHPCLYYHIGRCASPCTGKINREEYRLHVEQAKKLLSGETEGLLRDLDEKMNRAASGLNFEKAAEIRDTLEAIRTVGNRQEVVDFNMEKRDYVAMARRESLYSFAVFQMRSGKMLGRDLYRAESFGSDEDAFAQFFFQYYKDPEALPDVIYTISLADKELLRRFFREEFKADVDLQVPEEGRHSRILRMAAENAGQDVDRRLKAVANIPGLEELKQVLNLKKLPRRIEGFDIAQLSGKYPVASLVSFYNGNPDKKNYRRFHIKSLNGKIDDYEAIREAVARRYTRVLNEKLEKPDLLVIDGGRGQLNAALGVLDTLGIRDIPVIALAKQFEEIYTPDRVEPIRLPDGAEGPRVAQAVRDETHRIATTFNKSLRRRDINLPSLEGIPGIGPTRARALLEAFGSIESIREATVSQIVDEAGIPLKTAEKIIEILSQKN